MEYQDFLEQVKDSVQKRTGGGSSVRLASVLKNNRNCVEAMSILNGSGNVSPAIYMEPYYQQYLDGNSIDEVAEHIVEFHSRHAREGRYDLSFYTDFLQVRRRVVCRLVNYAKNRELLKQVPHRRFLDLAVVYYYKMEDHTFGDAGILVKNEHMEMWDADLEELDDAAMSNTARLMPYECVYIADMLKELTGIRIEECDEAQLPMYVLTNTEKSFGAATILYHTILEALGERFGCDFFVLPSSVHECMLVPASEEFEPEKLREIVCEINEECVAEEEVLGDSVYRYYRETGELTAVASGTAA